MPVLGCFALVGALAGLWLPITAPPQLLIQCLLGLSLPAWWLGGQRVLLLLSVFLLANLYCQWTLSSRLPDHLVGQDIVVSGTIADFPVARNDSVLFSLRTSKSTRRETGLTSLQLAVYQSTVTIQPAECWQLLVRLKQPRGLSNPGQQDRAFGLLVKGVDATGYVRASALNRPSRACSDDEWLLGVRSNVADRLRAAVGTHESFPLLQGITLGNRSGLDQSAWEVLRNTGTSHLLAISGLHIGMVAAFMWQLARWSGFLVVLWLPQFSVRLFAARLAGLTAVAYAALAGLSIPTFRACCMVCLIVLINNRQRSYTPGAVLVLVLITALYTNPSIILSAAFWLSYAAVFILFCRYAHASAADAAQVAKPVSGAGVRAWEVLQNWIHTQWVLSLGLAVPTLLFFNQLSLIAPLANLVAIPLFASFILPAAFSGLALLFLWDSSATLLLEFALTGLNLLLAGLQKCAQIPGAFWPAGQLDLLPGVLLASGASFLLLPRPLPSRAAGAVLLMSGMLLRNAAGNAEFTLHVLDVGQGLAIVIRQDNKALLYDTGPAWRSTDAGERIIEPVLRNMGIERIDVLVVSHWDQDHSGGLSSLAGALPVGKILAPTKSAEFNGPTDKCRTNMRWHWGPTQFKVLHPARASGWSDNNASCVLLITRGTQSILLSGDIEAGVESLIAREPETRDMDLVVAPHHGSSTSSSARLVLRTRPRFVVYSTGYANRWGFPRGEIVQRWRAAGSCSLNTASGGAVELRSSGSAGLQARLQKASWLRPWPLRLRADAPCTAAL